MQRSVTFSSVSSRLVALRVAHLVHVSTLSGRVLPYLADYEFSLPFGCQRSLFGPSLPHWRVLPLLPLAYRRIDHPGLRWGCHVPHRRGADGVGAAFTPVQGCTQRVPLARGSHLAHTTVLVNHRSGGHK